LRQSNDEREAPCQPHEVVELSNIRTLVVDDSSIWRRFIIEHLRDSRLAVIDVAYDGVQAVFKAQTLQPDLVIMDVALPHMNGIEAARQIRRVAPATAIVFLSGDDDPVIRRAALAAGGRDYVLKSLAGRELVNVIKRAFENAESA
jgi:DNA-binding NarL/FixJ family response regulator